MTIMKDRQGRPLALHCGGVVKPAGGVVYSAAAPPWPPTTAAQFQIQSTKEQNYCSYLPESAGIRGTGRRRDGQTATEERNQKAGIQCLGLATLL